MRYTISEKGVNLMQDRIKAVRKSNGLTQAEFAKSLGVTDAAISKIEKGVNIPSEQTLKLICSTYHVNYLWLTVGRGEMLEAESPADMIERLMAGESPLAISIMKAFAQLPAEEWNRLRDLIDQVKEKGLPE